MRKEAVGSRKACLSPPPSATGLRFHICNCQPSWICSSAGENQLVSAEISLTEICRRFNYTDIDVRPNLPDTGISGIRIVFDVTLNLDWRWDETSSKWKWKQSCASLIWRLNNQVHKPFLLFRSKSRASNNNTQIGNQNPIQRGRKTIIVIVAVHSDR